MSMQDMTLAAAAQNALTARISGFMDGLDVDKAAYAGLADDLAGAARAQMGFTAQWKPDEDEPDNVAGGVFASLALLVASAPAGADVNILIEDGATVHLSEYVYGANRRLYFRPKNNVNTATKPRIIFGTFIIGGKNSHYNFRLQKSQCSLRFHSCILEFAEKIEAGADWAFAGKLIAQNNGAPPITVSLERCDLIGTGPCSFIQAGLSSTVFLNAELTTIDGAITLVGGTSNCLLLMSTRTITLSNGAVLYSGGTIGTNILAL